MDRDEHPGRQAVRPETIERLGVVEESIARAEVRTWDRGHPARRGAPDGRELDEVIGAAGVGGQDARGPRLRLRRPVPGETAVVWCCPETRPVRERDSKQSVPRRTPHDFLDR